MIQKYLRALKSSIFVVQKAAAPKIGVEFRQGSIGIIRSSLATSSDISRRQLWVVIFCLVAVVVIGENKVNFYSDQLKLPQVCKVGVEFDNSGNKWSYEGITSKSL